MSVIKNLIRGKRVASNMMNRILAIRLLKQQAISYEEAFWVVMDEM